ncbi:kinase-like protein [Stipitochalara longipes BDJ]|nr:kinase-like protein [Stipitochalara longipes BDJ]
MSLPQHEYDDAESFREMRFLAVQLDGAETEDVEKYERGGFHPVHLGDVYDGRYRVVHKLGAGGFSTLSCNAASQYASDTAFHFVVEHRRFTLNGPNGHHLCLVLPVLGPSASDLSKGIYSRITPWLSCRASYQATRALADLHAQGLCHGDMTTANILFGLLDIDRYTESDIYRLFGAPETAPLETEFGETPGSEAPSYIVKALDFLSSEESVISKDMLGTPAEYLAPEVAVGLKASPASDIWALGCSIFRIRSGEGPFAGYEVTNPAELVSMVFRTLGELPGSWKDVFYDEYGYPTKEPTKGTPLEPWGDKRVIKDLIYKIWDEPDNTVITIGRVQPEVQERMDDENKPYPRCLSDTVWKPTAVKIDNVYICGYGDETDELLEAMPKISKNEAALLYDLLSKIFVYDAQKRPSARDMLSHPWFHMDGLRLCLPFYQLVLSQHLHLVAVTLEPLKYQHILPITQELSYQSAVMASSARYHLLPEEGRPSIDSIPDPSRRLIESDSETSLTHGKPQFVSSDFHITLYSRFITFAFFLAGAIVLGLRQGYHGPYWTAPSGTAIPSIVLLSIALSRNVFVIFSYFVTSAFEVSISVRFRGQGKSRSKLRIPRWLKGRMFGILLDGSIILALFITLPIGLVQSSGWYTRLQEGFTTALVGMPFYVLSIIDGGDPRSVAISLKLITRNKDEDKPVEPPQQYSDLEEQLPNITRIEPEAEGGAEATRENVDV